MLEEEVVRGAVKAYLDQSQIPVRFYSAFQVDEGERNHPIFHCRGVRIKWKYFQLDRVELVDGNVSFGIRVEIFVELFQNSVYSWGSGWR
jgi:hypothetical protein